MSWETRILEGEPIAGVAAGTPYSVSAARRHLRLHVQPQLLAEMRGIEAGIQLADFADRLVELAGHAARVRAYAEATSNGRLSLQAIQQERDTLVTLMSRLGVDSVEAAELHGEARVLTRAVAALVRSQRFPGLADDLADRLEHDGLENLARSLREVGTLSQQEMHVRKEVKE